MRCILVNYATLKSDTFCTFCRKKLGDSYARDIGSRFIYCDYGCYRRAAKSPVIAPGALATYVNTWSVNS